MRLGPIVAAMLLFVGTASAQAGRGRDRQAVVVVVDVPRRGDQWLDARTIDSLTSAIHRELRRAGITVARASRGDSSLDAAIGRPGARDGRATVALRSLARGRGAEIALDPTLVALRDTALRQPLPSIRGRSVDSVARALALATRPALEQLAAERACHRPSGEGRFDAAIAVARAAVATYPRATIARVCLLRALVAAHADPDSVLAGANELRAFDPRSALPLLTAADVHQSRRDHARAVEALNEAVGLEPWNQPLHRRLVRRVAGDDADSLARLAYSAASQMYRAFNADTVAAARRDGFTRLLSIVALSDTLAADSSTKFLLGVVVFNLVFGQLQDIETAVAAQHDPAACTAARRAADYLTLARTNVPHAMAHNRAAATQIMAALEQYRPMIERTLRDRCG